MNRTAHRLLLGTLLATSSAIALAQTPPPPAGPAHTGPVAARPGPGAQRDARPDPAQLQQRMAEHHARRMAELKVLLQITPAQEGAWTAFAAAMQPPAQPPQPPMARAELDKLTAPQRIDLQARHEAERAAHMKQRGDAVKAFYAQLNPEQQKVFDERGHLHGPGDGQRGKPRGGHHGHPGGPGGPGSR